MTVDLFVKLNNQSSTMTLLVGIQYFVRDLLSDVINNAWSTK